MNLDEHLHRLPLIGFLIKRLYKYFKRHTAVTDFFHVIMGLGLGLIIAEEELMIWGFIALIIGILFHVYAFIKGK